MSAKRIGFAGTPQFAATVLQSLLDSGFMPTVVYTQPDRPAGRGRKLQSSAVKRIAQSAGIAIEQPTSLKNPEALADLAAYELDLLIVVAYGVLLPQSILDTPHLGCINLHASKLPRWRGAAPIARAIEAGDHSTAVDIMQMQLGLDTGPVLASVEMPIAAHSAASATEALAALGAALLIDKLPAILTAELLPVAQAENAFYAHKLSKAEGLINWQQSAAEILRKIKAYNPYPVAHSALDGDVFRFWDAALGANAAADGVAGQVIACSKQGLEIQCGEGSINITQLQRPGSKPALVAALWHGLNLNDKVFGAVQ